MPGPKDSIRWALFSKAHLPLQLQSCHQWTFRVRDARRKNWLARNGSNQVTHLALRCAMLPTSACEPTATPWLETIEEGASPPDDVDLPQDIPWGTRVHLGWRVGFRQDTPE
eukprot:9192181-Prorocentrum_lima.AAC.1